MGIEKLRILADILQIETDRRDRLIPALNEFVQTRLDLAEDKDLNTDLEYQSASKKAQKLEKQMLGALPEQLLKNYIELEEIQGSLAALSRLSFYLSGLLDGIRLTRAVDSLEGLPGENLEQIIKPET